MSTCCCLLLQLLACNLLAPDLVRLFLKHRANVLAKNTLGWDPKRCAKEVRCGAVWANLTTWLATGRGLGQDFL